MSSSSSCKSSLRLSTSAAFKAASSRRTCTQFDTGSIDGWRATRSRRLSWSNQSYGSRNQRLSGCPRLGTKISSGKACAAQQEMDRRCPGSKVHARPDLQGQFLQTQKLFDVSETELQLNRRWGLPGSDVRKTLGSTFSHQLRLYAQQGSDSRLQCVRPGFCVEPSVRLCTRRSNNIGRCR